MSVKHAGYTAGYVAARKTVNPVNGFEWTDDVHPASDYGMAEDIAEKLGEGYSVYALVLADMDAHFDAMVYGRPAALPGTDKEPDNA